MVFKGKCTLTRRTILPALWAGVTSLALLAAVGPAAAQDAQALIKAAFDNWRSDTSETTINMTIHRPTWERNLTMQTYSRGNDDSLVRFTAPAKDAGNATLQLGKTTYLYNPKLNQVVKLPASLLAQPWMGSDFSYSDLARSDDVQEYYSLEIIGRSSSGGHIAYEIEATPNPGAPVVWGKQIVKVRDDGIILQVTYFNQDMIPARTMTTENIKTLGGRQFPTTMTMKNSDTPDEWTRIETTAAKFDHDLPDFLFTKSNLSNPRD